MGFIQKNRRKKKGLIKQQDVIHIEHKYLTEFDKDSKINLP